MEDCDRNYKETRDILGDYNHRQEFEHELLNRKTTWMLTTSRSSLPLTARRT
jgi:hypothetical protein